MAVAMADPGRDRNRPADDRAGRDDHENCAALGAAGAALLRRGPAVGGDAYALAFGSLLLLGGKLADVVGRKVMFLTGVTGFAAASAVGGAAVSFPMLISARAVQGAFAALLAPAALSLLATTFTDPDERRQSFAVYCGGRVRRGGRPCARRAADRVPVMAVVPVCERAVRRGRGRRRGDAAEPGHPRAAAAGRRARGGAGLRRYVLHRVRVLQRRHPLLGHPVHVGVHRRRGGPAGAVRAMGSAGRRAAAAAADRGRPNPGRGLPGHAAGRRGDVRDRAVPELLHAAEPGLLPGDHWAGVLAVGGPGDGRR